MLAHSLRDFRGGLGPHRHQLDPLAEDVHHDEAMAVTFIRGGQQRKVVDTPCLKRKAELLCWLKGQISRLGLLQLAWVTPANSSGAIFHQVRPIKVVLATIIELTYSNMTTITVYALKNCNSF